MLTEYDMETGEMTFDDEVPAQTTQEAMINKLKIDDGEEIEQAKELPDEYIKPETEYEV